MCVIIELSKIGRRNNMVISSKEFQPVLVDYMNFISSGKIPEPAYLHFLNQPNKVSY